MSTKYTIILKSQLGPKTGSLKIRESSDKLWGILEILGHKSLLVGKVSNEDQDFEFKGKIWTPLGFIECFLAASKVENGFGGKLKVENKIYEISGKR